MKDTGAAIRSLEAIAYALITAMGMAAENQVRADQGKAPAHDEGHFLGVAEDMRRFVLDMASFV
jgi:hypothetical protein